MGYKALDSANITTGYAKKLFALGYRAFGFYLRADRAPQAMLHELHTAGLKLFSIWERGHPTSAAYFTKSQGAQDGHLAAAYAHEIGQPAGTTISPCVDYDSNPDDVKDYLIAFHDVIKAAGYKSLPYGNGDTLKWAVDSGYAYGGFLSQSKGFSGYSDFLPHAKIVQGSTATVLKFDVDYDTVVDESVCW